ncbi:MAG: hypothetical protein E7394_06090 [Ruminococcaceae bacterium]|nr:hypothetical protein [Oscillospiraceae bacterium]
MSGNIMKNLSMADIEILVENEKKLFKKWLLIGICMCIIGTITLANLKGIGDFIHSVSPKTKAEAFDRNGEQSIYSFMEIDFIEPFYSDRISQNISGRYESAEHNYYLIGNSKTNEFAIANINHDSIIEDFSTNSEGYIVYGESQNLSLPELEYSKNKSDEEKKNEIILDNSVTIDGKTYSVPHTIMMPDLDVIDPSSEITADYSIEAIKKLAEKFDVSESELSDFGKTSLYVLSEPKTDTSVLSASLYIIFIFLILCTILGFIPILWAASNIDKCNEKPIKFKKSSVYFNSNAFLWIVSLLSKKLSTLPDQFEYNGSIKLSKKEPIISFYEDGVKTVEYCLQTEGEEDFKEKYFLISVRVGFTGNPPTPTMQMDGFISDTSEERKMTLNDIGYRMEGHYLVCGGDLSKQRHDASRGQDLVMKGLKYPGYTTPANIRLIGICPDCGKSFAFHGYAFYMAQSDVAYSDDGLDVCEIVAYNIDKESWKYETEGKTFRYYNSFNCPYCGVPYIDYKKHPKNKVFGVSGCVHLGRKHYKAE